MTGIFETRMRFAAMTSVPHRALRPLVAACALAAACGPPPDGAAGRAGIAEAAGSPIRRAEFVRELLLTGELEAVRSISIKAPQTRIFQMRIQFMAEEGSFVRKGDPLLGFDNSALADQVRDLETRILDAETQIVAKQAEIASALKDLEIEVAEKEYEFERARLDAGVDPAVLSRKEYGERQLALEKAREELQEVRERIALTRNRGQADLDVLNIDRDKLRTDLEAAREGMELLSIAAPTDGLVVYEERHRSTARFQEGDSCWPGQEVMRLPDLSEMQVVFNVSEVDAPLLHPGIPVQITLDAFPGRELRGEILSIPSMAVKRSEESKVAVFKVPARLEETWQGEMKPGMSALGQVVLERVPDALVVPRSAVRLADGEYRLVGRGKDGAEVLLERIHPVDRNPLYYRLADDGEPSPPDAGEPTEGT